MQRNRYTTLALLLIAAGALALAGCGGDDGGLSAEDMARLDAAEMAAAAAAAEAEAAEAAAEAAQAEAEAAQAEAEAAQAEAEAAKMTAEDEDTEQAEALSALTESVQALADAEAERQAAAKKAADEKAAADKKAAEEKAAADAMKAAEMEEQAMLADIWEAIAGDAIAADIVMQLPAGTGPVSVTALRDAILATAGKYSLDSTSAIAFLNETHPVSELIQRSAADAFLTAMHAAGHLAATAKSVAVVQQGNQGPPGSAADPEAVEAMVYEEIAGAAIAADLMARVAAIPRDPGGGVPASGIRSAIDATAAKYGLGAAAATAAKAHLTALHPIAILEPTAVTAFLASLHAGNFLPANSQAAAVKLADDAAMLVADVDDNMDMDDDDMDMDDDDMDEPMGLAAVLANPDADVDGATRADPGDFALPEGTKMTDEGGGINSFSARVGQDYGGFGDDTFNTLGLWAEGVAAFTVLSGRPGGSVMADTAIVGVAIDAPQGRSEGRGVWIGEFIGAHLVDPGTEFDSGTAEADMVNRGDSAMGSVRLDVNFSKAGYAHNLMATVDNFVPGHRDHKHVFGTAAEMVTVTTRGSFENPTALQNTASDLTHGMSKISGQFYESGDESAVAGSVTLINGYHATSMEADDMPGDGGTALTGLEIDGSDGYAVGTDGYFISGVFVATE